ncbi:MAG: septum formation initiator family protein [Vicinamibacteria bacterium]|nr:septum formation initiator family protein [Vicinamibacteria bacterium]
MPSSVNQPSRTPRLKGLAIAALVVCGIAYAALRDDEGIRHVFRERSRLQDLNHSVEGLREENNRLRAEIKALREDPRAVEKLAREDLGLSRPGEIVFILEGDPSDPSR